MLSMVLEDGPAHLLQHTTNGGQVRPAGSPSSSEELPPDQTSQGDVPSDPVALTLLPPSSTASARIGIVSPPPKELPPSGEVLPDDPTAATAESATPGTSNNNKSEPVIEASLLEDDAVASAHPPTVVASSSPSTTHQHTQSTSPGGELTLSPKSAASTRKRKAPPRRRPVVRPSGSAVDVDAPEPEAASLPWKPCHVHRPTLSGLQAHTFSDYIRHTVLQRARPTLEPGSDADDHEDNSDDGGEPCHFDHGMAKIVLPEGLLSLRGIASDQTARGPDWQPGTVLGDRVIGTPMHQHVRGLAGTYSYALMDQPTRTVAEFRQQADAYRADLLPARLRKEEEEERDEAVEPSAPGSDLPATNHGRLAELERHFWKRLGPTMPPATYGADQEGTLFHDDDAATGWSLGHLDSCLHVLGGRVPGVTSPYLYFGMWASVFCAHTEDMNLLSINYLHAGAPKIWYAVPSAYASRFQALAAACFCHEKCPEFLRHKQSLISPQVLQKAGIPFSFAVQHPGEAVVTFPGAYHFGFNAGFNVAEATNFGVPEWIPFGRRARVCLCRPDSVRIDMDQFCRLLDVYTASQKARRRGARLSWKAWGDRRHPPPKSTSDDDEDEDEEEAAAEENNKGDGAAESSKHHEPSPTVPKAKTKGKQSNKKQLSEQQRKGEFWVEVMKPVARKSITASSSKASAASAASSAKKKKPTKDRKSNLPLPQAEVWHLARPVIRKKLVLGARVLVILPATELGGPSGRSSRGIHDRSSDSGDDEGMTSSDLEDGPGEEECFAGRVAEATDEHVRVRFDGLSRTEDVWMHQCSPKLFFDGGRWSDEDTSDAKAVPVLHYWQEMDSKRRCVGK